MIWVLTTVLYTDDADRHFPKRRSLALSSCVIITKVLIGEKKICEVRRSEERRKS